MNQPEKWCQYSQKFNIHKNKVGKKRKYLPFHCLSVCWLWQWFRSCQCL